MDSIEDKIAQLVDMGFTPEQAKAALKVSNNNVQTAISYLFEEPIEVQDIPDTNAASRNVDTVAIQNPSDIPDLIRLGGPESPSPSTAARQLELEVDETDGEQTPDEDVDYQISNEDHIEAVDQLRRSLSPVSLTTTSSVDSKVDRNGASSAHSDDTSKSKTGGASSGSIFEKLSTYHFDSDIPKLVVPINPSNLENFYIPFLVILSQLSEFQDIIFNEAFQFIDYGWDANWYNKSDLSFLLPTTISKKQEKAYRQLVEIQRIVGFLTKDDSRRLFISTWNLLKNLHEEFFDSELIEEIIPKIYESLNTSILEVLTAVDLDSKKVEAVGSKLESLFKSVVYSESEEQLNNIYHIDIESNRSNKNIYHSFNELIWGNDMEQLGQIYFTKLSDYITISKINDLHYNHGAEGQFQILEAFFPQIYSKKYKDLIISLNQLKESIFQRKLELVKKLNKLTFFEGKKLNGILEGTLEVFQDNDKVSSELKAILNEVELGKVKINEELETLSKVYAVSDITSVDNILKAIKESEGDELEPYVLTGVIQLQNEYCYRQHGSDEWVYVKFLERRSRDLIEDIECVSFDSFEQLIGKLDIFDTEISTYTYVKKSVWEKTSNHNLPNGLKAFFNRDNGYREEKNREEEEKGKGGEAEDQENSNDDAIDVDVEED